jgi:hypothetical protein
MLPLRDEEKRVSLWILFVIPMLPLALFIRNIFENPEFSFYSSNSAGFSIVLLGSLIPLIFIFGNRVNILKPVLDRFINPWGYFGYIPVGILTLILIGLGVYLILKSN